MFLSFAALYAKCPSYLLHHICKMTFLLTTLYERLRADTPCWQRDLVPVLPAPGYVVFLLKADVLDLARCAIRDHRQFLLLMAESQSEHDSRIFDFGLKHADM